LNGIKVVDLTRNLAGPNCTMILADMGAAVIKIESTREGDDTRAWQPPAWNGVGATFLSTNRNKRSLAIDLDTPEGQDVVRQLVSTADVVVESFRPGSLAKRGLDYATLSQGNKGLIYCSISAYGHRGPKSAWPGYDPVLQADTGIMDITGYPDGPPARLGIGAIDLGTALWATIGIQAALANRSHSGDGALIEASLFETSVWWMSYHLLGYLGSGVTPRRQGSGTPFIAPYELFGTADGDLFITAGNDGLFAELARTLEHPELIDDDRFAHNHDRVANRVALRRILQASLDLKSALEWERLLTERGIPCSTVKSVADLAKDPQLAALELLSAFPHPDVPNLRLVDLPISSADQRASHLHPPPSLGEHTREILMELGLSDETILDLSLRGCVMIPADHRSDDQK
jgi:crotonobetainyl-CoA:carnitine CoA-transferase CaiB-like acyl-CoA transferase